MAILDTWTPSTLKELHAMAEPQPARAAHSPSARKQGVDRRSMLDYVDVEGSAAEEGVHDPLTNPAIPFEDEDDTYTPCTLKDMLELNECYEERKRLRFFDLPSEIRNTIYSYVLTPEGGFPMDFASCADCEHAIYDYTKKYANNEPTPGLEWFASQWKEMRYQFRNLGVSRRFHREGTTTFYGQPFRFTSDCDWIMLYHFLDMLGWKNMQRVKNITVCHPVSSSSPEITRHRGDWRYVESRHVLGDYHDLFRQHMGAFGFKSALLKSYATPHRSLSWLVPGKFGGTAWLLTEAMNLTKLTLTLPQFQYPSEQFPFKTPKLEDQPINGCYWPQGQNLTRTIVHLVSSCHDCSNKLRKQPCMAEIHGECPQQIAAPEDEEVIQSQNPHSSDSRISESRAEEARGFFDAAREKGWIVTEHFYDYYAHYPVKKGQHCVNEKLCKYLEESDEPNLLYDCPGSVYEALAHQGLSRMTAWNGMRLRGLDDAELEALGLVRKVLSEEEEADNSSFDQRWAVPNEG